MSEEAKKKMSIAHKGKKRPPFTDETRRRMQATLERNKTPRSEEYLKNMALAQQGKLLSTEHKAKISSGVRRRLDNNPQYKKNVSEGLKRRWTILKIENPDISKKLFKKGVRFNG
jgi:hypothetical protein